MTATRNSVPAPAPSPANRYPSTRQFSTAERMDILRSPAGPGFLPSSKGEVDAAFLRWHHSEKGGEPLDRTLDHIFYNQQMLIAGKPEPAILSVVGQRAAYFRQALKDQHTLMSAGKDLVANPIPDDSTMTAAQFFRGVPAHDGPGQLVRFIDMGRIADGALPTSFEFNPLGGEVRKSKISGSWGLVDPYITAVDRKVREHMGEVLEGIMASDLLNLVEEATADQMGRMKFWGDVMVEAHREALARPIAHAALTAPGAAAFYPEFNQPEANY